MLADRSENWALGMYLKGLIWTNISVHPKVLKMRPNMHRNIMLTRTGQTRFGSTVPPHPSSPPQPAQIGQKLKKKKKKKDRRLSAQLALLQDFSDVKG